MKIAMVLLAAVALIGSAAAWDYTDRIYYERVFTGYEQANDLVNPDAGDPIDHMIGAESGTYFKSMDSNNDVLAGAVFNKLAGTLQPIPSVTNFKTAGSNTMGAEPWSQTLTLTQTGGARVVSRALDTNDGPEIEASINTYQNLRFSGAKYQGNYDSVGGPAVYAQFQSEGNAGVVGDYVLTSFTNLESAPGRAQPAMIETSKADTFFTSADLGMSSIATMAVDEIGGPVFGGKVVSFAEFAGGRGTGVIEANAGGFENHVMVFQGNNINANLPNVITTGWTNPVGENAAFNAQQGFVYW